MVMALGTLHGNPQNALAEGIGFIDSICHTILFFDNAALFSNFMVSIECRRKDLFLRRLRHHITGKLPRHEPVIRHVLVECVDYPITPWPLRTHVVILVTI